MQVVLINNQNKTGFDSRALEKVSSYISNKFDPDSKKTLNIILVSDKEIKRLNHSYRNVDNATDVLSFSYLDDVMEKDMTARSTVIGEIYISPATAQKNASEQGEEWSLELEIMLLIIHGTLHIYGYDHKDDEEKAVMYNIQDSLMHDIRSKNWNST